MLPCKYKNVKTYSIKHVIAMVQVHPLPIAMYCWAIRRKRWAFRRWAICRWANRRWAKRRARGIIQGDYLFIFYLAKALSSRPPLETERYVAILVHLDSHVKLQPKCWITRRPYTEHPDVAPLPQCEARYSFNVRATFAGYCLHFSFTYTVCKL